MSEGTSDSLAQVVAVDAWCGDSWQPVHAESKKLPVPAAAAILDSVCFSTETYLRPRAQRAAAATWPLHSSAPL